MCKGTGNANILRVGIQQLDRGSGGAAWHGAMVPAMPALQPHMSLCVYMPYLGCGRSPATHRCKYIWLWSRSRPANAMHVRSRCTGEEGPLRTRSNTLLTIQVSFLFLLL